MYGYELTTLNIQSVGLGDVTKLEKALIAIHEALGSIPGTAYAESI